jgi:hypothetical protein
MKRSNILRALVVLFAGATMLAGNVAFGQRDAGSKIRGEFGTGFYGQNRARAQSTWRGGYQPSYRVMAPRIVPENQAPLTAPQVARAPTTGRRAFSLEPGVQAQSTQRPQPAVRYYEPQQRWYGVPRGNRSNRTPSYMLPKTDPRRFG